MLSISVNDDFPVYLPLPLFFAVPPIGIAHTPLPPQPGPSHSPPSCSRSSRHVADWPTRQGAGCLPEYALHLAFSLAEAVPPLLSSTLPGGNTHGATGPLLVAACMLRFVSVAATAVFDEPTRVPPRVHGAALVAEGGDGTGAAELLVGELWASGCLEACVYVLGVVPLRGTPPDSAEGSGCVLYKPQFFLLVIVFRFVVVAVLFFFV